MDNFKSACTDFMSNMIEDTLSNLNLENTEYRKCQKSERNNVKTISEILNRLSAEDKEVINRHEMDIFHISAFEQSYLYKQGFTALKASLREFSIISIILLKF